jgi:hypothetical protein
LKIQTPEIFFSLVAAPLGGAPLLAQHAGRGRPIHRR